MGLYAIVNNALAHSMIVYVKAKSLIHAHRRADAVQQWAAHFESCRLQRGGGVCGVPAEATAAACNMLLCKADTWPS